VGFLDVGACSSIDSDKMSSAASISNNGGLLCDSFDWQGEATLTEVTRSISRKLVLLCCWDVSPTYSEVEILVAAVQILVEPPILLVTGVAESWCPSTLLMRNWLVWLGNVAAAAVGSAVGPLCL
jgi:hypothetical protein